MRVNEIKKSEDKTTKYSNTVIFEDGSTLTVSKSEMAEFGLFADSNVGFDNIETLETCVLERRGKTYALRLLTRSNLSASQLEKKLKEQEYSNIIISSVMFWLEERGIINDELFVENFITYNKKNKSKKQIIYKLMDKGIEKNIIIDKLETAEFDEIEDAIEMAKKKMRPFFIDGLPDSLTLRTQKDKILGYLFRKGFAYESCKNAVSIAIKALSEEFLE